MKTRNMHQHEKNRLFSEKRKAPRFPFESDSRVELRPNGGDLCAGRIVNLSMTGLLVECTGYRQHSDLPLELFIEKIGENDIMNFTVSGRAARIDKAKYGEHTLVGIELSGAVNLTSWMFLMNAATGGYLFQ